MKQPTLESELQSLLNRYSAENGSDTPDFILAKFLLGCLESYDKALVAREKHHGRTVGGIKPLSFGKRLKMARGTMPQSQAAQVMSTSIHTLRNWEQGRNQPSLETQAICLSLLAAELNPDY